MDQDGQIQYKIADVSPVESIENIKRIRDNKSKTSWLTIAPITSIILEFESAQLTQISIKNAGSQKVDIILQGTQFEVSMERVIDNEEVNWISDIETMVSVEDYQNYKGIQLIITNNDGKPHGIQWITLYSPFQEETQDKKQQRKIGNTKRKEVIEREPGMVLQKADWDQYKTSPKAGLQVYQNPRENLQRLQQKSPQPLSDSSVEKILETNEDVRVAEETNENEMCKFRYCEVDQQFLIYHHLLQQSANVPKHQTLNETNYNRVWNL